MGNGNSKGRPGAPSGTIPPPRVTRSLDTSRPAGLSNNARSYNVQIQSVTGRRLVHSISCPSGDHPNATARVTELSKSATSHNESLLTISLEEENYSFSHSQHSHDSSSSSNSGGSEVSSSRDDVFEDQSEEGSGDSEEENESTSQEERGELDFEDLEIISLDSVMSKEEHADLNQSARADTKSCDEEVDVQPVESSNKENSSDEPDCGRDSSDVYHVKFLGFSTPSDDSQSPMQDGNAIPSSSERGEEKLSSSGADVFHITFCGFSDDKSDSHHSEIQSNMVSDPPSGAEAVSDVYDVHFCGFSTVPDEKYDSHHSKIQANMEPGPPTVAEAVSDVYDVHFCGFSTLPDKKCDGHLSESQDCETTAIGTSNAGEDMQPDVFNVCFCGFSSLDEKCDGHQPKMTATGGPNISDTSDVYDVRFCGFSTPSNNECDNCQSEIPDNAGSSELSNIEDAPDVYSVNFHGFTALPEDGNGSCPKDVYSVNFCGFTALPDHGCDSCPKDTSQVAATPIASKTEDSPDVYDARFLGFSSPPDSESTESVLSCCSDAVLMNEGQGPEEENSEPEGKNTPDVYAVRFIGFLDTGRCEDNHPTLADISDYTATTARSACDRNVSLEQSKELVTCHSDVFDVKFTGLLSL